MLLLIAALLSASDTVHGRVHDLHGMPLAGAEIIVADVGRLAMTASDGRFIIATPAHATLVVRHVGYATRTLMVNGAADLDVALAPAPFAIDPINVTARRAPRAAHGSLAVSVLGHEQLQRGAGVSIAHELDDLPGVRTLSTGEQVGKPVIRGLFGSRVLVLEDALRLEDYSWSDEDAPSIDARFADRIELVRGPASLLYGSDAVGGVVNVVPAPVPQPGSGFRRQSVEVNGSTNRQELGVTLQTEGSARAFGWHALLIGRRAQDFDTPQGRVANTGYGALNGELALGTQHEWGSLTARVAHYGGEFKLLEMDAPQSAPGVEEGPERKLSDDRLQIVGMFPMGAARLETRAQVQRHWLQEVADLPGSPAQPGREIPVFDLLLQTFSFDAFLHRPHGQQAEGTLGASLVLQSHDSRGPLVVVPDKSISNLALTALEHVRTGRFDWSVGARLDRHHVDAALNALTFNAGTVAQLTQALSLRANVGRAWRAPNLFELYANGPRIGEARYEMGDPNLDPERSFELDAGVDVATPDLRIDVTAYHNRISDFIALQPTARFQDNLRVYEHEQVTARLRGIEASAEVTALGALRMGVAYDAVRGDDVVHDTPLPWIPAPRMRAHVELAGTAASFPHAYVSGALEHTFAKTRTAANEPRVASYTLLHAGLGVEAQLVGRVVRLDLATHNLTNVAYRDFLNRYRDFALNPGRDFTVRLSTQL